MMIKRNVHCVRGQQELQRWNSQIKTLYQWNLILKGLIRPLLAGRHQMETGKEQLRTNCSILLFKWVVNHPDMWPFSSLPSSFSLIRPFIPSDSPSIPPRLLIFRLHFKRIIPPVIRLSWRTRVVPGPLSSLCPQPSCLKRPSVSRCPSTRETWCRSWRSCGRSFLSSNPRPATAASRSAGRRYLR